MTLWAVLRKREGGVWHRCSNCPEYPHEGEFSEVLLGRQLAPSSTECRVCLDLIAKGECEAAEREAESQPEPKKRPYPYPGHWHRQQP